MALEPRGMGRSVRLPILLLAPLLTLLPVACAAPPPGGMATLEAEAASLLDALPARTSLYARHPATGREVAIRADEPVNTLSVIKIPMMIQAYRDADAGLLDLDARVRIRPEDLRRGSGVLQSFAPGLEPTVRDLLVQMIITSDNTATDMILERVGMDRVNRTLEELGYRETRVQASTGDLFRRVWEMLDPAHAALTPREVFERGFPTDEGASARSFAFEGTPEEWLGRTTAREMTRLLEQLLAGELASPEATREMLSILNRQLYRSRLPRRIAFRAGVGNKTGDWPPIAGNDVGIIYGPGEPIVVSVFATQNTGDFLELEDAHARIAELLLEAWGGT